MQPTTKVCLKCGHTYFSNISICPKCGKIDKFSTALDIAGAVIKGVEKLISKK